MGMVPAPPCPASVPPVFLPQEQALTGPASAPACQRVPLEELRPAPLERSARRSSAPSEEAREIFRNGVREDGELTRRAGAWWRALGPQGPGSPHAKTPCASSPSSRSSSLRPHPGGWPPTP